MNASFVDAHHEIRPILDEAAEKIGK